MKINELTEDNIKELKDGSYVIFNERNILIDIMQFVSSRINESENKYCCRPFNDLYGEYGGDNLADFKKRNKDCEMFPIELIKKPI